MATDKELSDYWLAVYRGKWIVYFLAASSAAVAYFISVNLPPVYEAKSVFYVPVNSNPVRFTGEGFSTSIAQGPLKPIAESKQASVSLGILQSRPLMEAVRDEVKTRSLEELRRNVDFVVSGEFMIEVYVRDTDPGRAAAIANLIPKNFGQFHLDVLGQRVRRVIEALEAQHDRVIAEISKFDAELQRLSAERVIPSAQTELETQSELRREVTKALDQTEADLRDHRERLNRIDVQLSSGSRLYRETETLRLDQLREETAIRGLEARISALRESIAGYEREQASYPVRTAPLRDRERVLGRLRESQADLEANLTEARLQLVKDPGALVLVERAVPPERPSFPIPGLNAIIAAVVGLIVGAYYALFLDYIAGLRQRRLQRDMDWTVVTDYLRNA